MKWLSNAFNKYPDIFILAFFAALIAVFMTGCQKQIPTNTGEISISIAWPKQAVDDYYASAAGDILAVAVSDAQAEAGELEISIK